MLTYQGATPHIKYNEDERYVREMTNDKFEEPDYETGDLSAKLLMYGYQVAVLVGPNCD